MDVAQDLV